MSDSAIPPQLPPAPPAPPASPPAAARAAPVISAPPAATPPEGESITLPARVAPETPPVAGQVRLRTDRGDIVVKTDTPLPPDIEVSVDIQRQRAALVATIRIATARDAATSEALQAPAPQQAPPPTPVTAGDRLLAIVLSGSVEVKTPAPLPLPTGQALDALAQKIQTLAQQLLKTGATATSGVPAPLLSGLAASKNPAGFLSALAPDQQQKMLMLLPATDRPAPPPATPAAAPLLSPEPPADGGLLSLLKAMTSARLTQQALQPAPAAPSAPQPAGNLLGLLKDLLPVIQGVGAEGLNRGIAMPSPLATAQPPAAGAEIRIVAIGTPALPAPQAPVAPPLLTGEVIGLTKDGMPVIKSPVADFVLNSRVQLPVGTQITFEATPLGLADMAARISGSEDGFSFLPLASRDWPALDDALQILLQHAPAAAQNLQNTVPAPGPKMVPSTLFFLAALRLGMVENWLGAQALQVLRDHGGARTADRLGQDFARIGQQATEPLSGDWRGVSIPLLHNAQLEQIQLFTRRQQDEAEAGAGGETTRFLLNLSLNRMGDMQLDGLMRKTAKQGALEKRLDMVIRTDARLADSLMRDLQEGFARGLREAQLTGRLEFQSQRRGWVHVETAVLAAQSV